MSDRQAIGKLLHLLSLYKHKITFLVISMMVMSGLNFCVPLLSKSMMDEGFIGGNMNLLIRCAVLIAGIQILRNFANAVNERNRIDISTQMEFELLDKAVTHLLHIRMNYYDTTNNTEVMNVIYTDIGNMVMVTDRAMFFIVTQVFSMIGGIIGLLIISKEMTVIVVLFVPVKYVVTKFFARRQKKLMGSYIDEVRECSGWFGDMIAGIQEIKLYNAIQQKKQEFVQIQTKVIEKKKCMVMNDQWNLSIEGMVLELLTMLLYIAGAIQVFQHGASLGSVFAFVTYSCYVTTPISSILNIGYTFAEILPSTKRFYKFMEMEEERSQGIDQIETFSSLKLQNVSFAYNSDNKIFDNVSCCIGAGSKVAIIGDNGVGKSTLIKLLTRIYEPQNGTILFGDKNIADYDLNTYRSRIAVVSQQVYLFDSSIRENITLYKKVSDLEIQQIIHDCGLDEFIQSVGIDYHVGRDGALLSGGQKQKIALARALIQDTPIIIFDEVTSNADIKSEIRLNKLLNTRLKDKTVLIITHRKSVLDVVDQILEIENKKIRMEKADGFKNKKL